jgi:hypothetical protein
MNLTPSAVDSAVQAGGWIACVYAVHVIVIESTKGISHRLWKEFSVVLQYFKGIKHHEKEQRQV